MTTRVVFTPLAEAEFRDAEAWYGERSPNASRGFVARVDALVERIAENPLQFPVFRSDARRALFRNFPYALIFRIGADEIQIVACYHTSRDPRRLARRLRR